MGSTNTNHKFDDASKLKWLYIDMNSFFASCEQQDNVKYRNRPLIVVPTLTDYTSAIAASYEAKFYGIKTGTSVLEAKQKIPNLIIQQARPNRYVDFHNRILEAIDKIIPIDSVCSIDEFACLLMGSEKIKSNAHKIAVDIQNIIRKDVGICLTSSIGVAPSKLLAKTAADMKKPLGVTIIGMDDLPQKILDLNINDFAGIGKSMEGRLRLAGVNDTKTLWELSPTRMRQIWNSIVGDNFWYSLHGSDPPIIETKRTSIGHSHVLPPQLRPMNEAYFVSRRLVVKCGSRLRRMGYKTNNLMVSLTGDNRRKARSDTKFIYTSDTFKLLLEMDKLWVLCVKSLNSSLIKKVSITCNFLKKESEDKDLFGWSINGQENMKNMKLLNALDGINLKYGKDTIAIGAMKRIHTFVGSKIAFTRIPDEEDFFE